MAQVGQERSRRRASHIPLPQKYPCHQTMKGKLGHLHELLHMNGVDEAVLEGGGGIVVET